ncbi:periplasmic heavy metal sensor [bacterium]|nr:periplasmic heavy metal sensor [bacterium]RQV98036.1 MAG: periplasmic heavy metal sensor [bacterium]
MKKRTTTIILILSLAFNVAFLGSLGYRLWQKNREADSRLTRFDRRNEESVERERPTEEFPERPNFRPEEMAQIEEIRQMFEPRIREIQDELMEKRRALIMLMEEHEEIDPDTFTIYEHIDEIGDLQAELEKEVTRQILMARTVLDSAGQRQFFWMLGRRMGSDFPDMRSPRQDNQNNRSE